MKSRKNRAITVVLLLGMLLGSGAWATACPEGDTGAGSSVGGGKPVVELPKEMKSIKFRVTWEPADTPVHIKTYLDGSHVDHGVKRGGSWGMDGIGKSSAFMQADAGFRPDALHCDIQVGWQHYENWNKGNSWSCDAHWSSETSTHALGPVS